MLGLAAVVAIAAMAFLGTSGAAASELYIALCGNDELECANPLTHIHEVDTSPQLLTTSGTVTCEEALFLGDVLSPGGLAHLSLSITGRFTYKDCELEGIFCEVKELKGPASISVMKTADELGEVLGEGEVLVNCGIVIHCVYNGKGLKGHAYGALSKPSNGLVTAHEQTVNKVSGLLCPTTSKLDVLFAPLSPVYIKS
jgi:hypothetical protein